VGGKKGCDAIIVSVRKDKLGPDELDSFHKFTYVAERKNGALSMTTSFKSGFVIRVFRSTRYNSPFKAISNSRSAQYRYDGLYNVKLVRLQSESYFFHLERVVAGTRRNENVETTTSFIQFCIQNETMLPYPLA
jgi:hypothetical protein